MWSIEVSFTNFSHFTYSTHSFAGFWEPKPGVKLQVAIKELKKGVTEGRVNFVAEAVTMKNLR